MIEELEALERLSRAARRDRAPSTPTSPILKRGIALTPVMFGISFTLIHLNQAGALVHVYTDGSIHLNHGGTEMGQGLFTKVAQVVAEEFGVPLDWVRITATNTAKVPNASPTAASSGTDLNGMAAQIAARARSSAAWPRFAGRALERRRRRRSSSATGACSAATPRWASASWPRRAGSARVQLSAAGYYKTPKIHWDRDHGDRPAVLLFRLRRGLLRGRDRHADRRDEGAARRHPARRRRLAQSGARHRPGRGRLHPGHGLADDRGAGVRRQGPADDARAVDLQDPGRLRRAARSSARACTCGRTAIDSIYRSKAVGEPPLMLAIAVYSAILDAVHATDAGRPAEARSALHAGIDLERDPVAPSSPLPFGRGAGGEGFSHLRSANLRNGTPNPTPSPVACANPRHVRRTFLRWTGCHGATLPAAEYANHRGAPTRYLMGVSARFASKEAPSSSGRLRSTVTCSISSAGRRGWSSNSTGGDTAILTDYDEERSKVLEAAGAHVLRFTNEVVCNDLESVLLRIVGELRLPFE